MHAMREHLFGRAPVYEVEYRIQTKNGKYKWYYDRGKITQYDEAGSPLFLAGIVFDITETKEAQQELESKNKVLEDKSSIDGLTQISNHLTLIDYLRAGIGEASRVGTPLSVALIDIDDFKLVNDFYGHVAGDQVLVELAAILKRNTRSTDLAGRYGGEEFMVVFLDVELARAAEIAERMRKTIADHSFAGGIKITASFGVKQYQGEDVTYLVHEADRNLYEAKKAGKNRVVAK